MADALGSPPLAAATRPVRRGPRRVFAGLVCVVAALIALLVVELVRAPASSGSSSLHAGASSGHAADPAGLSNAALQDAIDEGPTLFSYDYRTLDKDLAAARAVTTGAFTTQYDQVSVPAVKPLAVKYQVVVSAKVLAATVVDDSNLKAIKVMLFLDQVVKNSQLAAPRLDANRTILTMVPVGKGWRVAGVSAI
jgi:Mce-associated membrane protein